MEEQRSRQPVFQAASHMTRLVLQVEPNPRKRGKRDRQQVRVGRSTEVGLDVFDRPPEPLPAGVRPADASHAIAGSAVGTSRGTVNVNVEPTPGVLSTETSPPRMWASLRLTASPSPVPP